MAKRAPNDEQPYRPLLDPGVISAALTKASPIAPSPGRDEAVALKVVELSRAEVPRLQPPRSEAAPPPLSHPLRPEPRNTPQLLVEKFDQEKRILLTRSEASTLDRLVSTLAGRLGTQI